MTPHSLPSRRCFLGMTAATLLAVSGARRPGSGTAHTAESAYAMCYFTESTSLGEGTDYGLHPAVSKDSLNWMPLNQNDPLVTPTEGDRGLRDPFILRKRDGMFVVIATDLKGTDWAYVSQYNRVRYSTDLRTFTGYHRLKLHDMNTHAWAPEAFWDPGRRQNAVIHSAVDSSGHNVIMVNYTTDFRTASAPQVFFDPGYDVIDGDLAMGPDGVNYLCSKKDQTFVGARSTSLDPGSFTEFTTGVAHGGTEAPTLVKSLTVPHLVPVGRHLHTQRRLLRLAVERPRRRHRDRPRPEDLHPAARLQALRHHDDQHRRIPQPRRQVGQAHLEPPEVVQPSGPLRPPLRLPAAPRRRRRHGGVRRGRHLPPHTGPGRADASWASFRSHNHPDRHIRHSDYVLRIDLISTTTDRQDATFRVGY